MPDPIVRVWDAVALAESTVPSTAVDKLAAIKALVDGVLDEGELATDENGSRDFGRGLAHLARKIRVLLGTPGINI